MTGRLTGWLRGRPTTTESTATLWAKALLDAVLFSGVFMAALPWGAHRLLPQALPLPPAIRTLGGVVLIVIGVCTFIACIDTFIRRRRRTPIPAEAPRHLVTNGLFRVMRDPIIVADLMVTWGVALYVASVGVVLYALVASVVGQLMVLYIEEPEFRRRFGESYDAYCRDVPRWVPRFRPKRG